MNRKNQIISLILLSFFIGIMVGILLSGIFFMGKVSSLTESSLLRQNVLLNNLSRKLDLSEEQEVRVGEEINNFFSRIEEDREVFQERIRPKLDDTLDSIKAVLDGEQMEKLDLIIHNLYPLFESEES